MTGSAFILTGVLALSAAPRYVASEILPEAELRSHATADLDGDGRGDLLVGVWSEGGGRELLVHLQRENGAFAPVPDRRVDVKSDIVAFAAADVRAEPGEELLLFTQTACYSLSTEKSGYAGNAERLFECSLLCALPDPKEVLRLGTVTDLDGDGAPDVLVPGEGECRLYSRGPTGSYATRVRIALPALGRAPPDRRERRLELRLGGESSRARARTLPDRVTAWTGGEGTGGGDLLRSESWVPGLHVADADGDGLRDLLHLDPSGEDGTLKIHRQERNGRLSPMPGWSGRLEGVGSLWPGDFDGDGRIDLVAGRSDRADEMKLRFFRNRGGTFLLEEPDQVLKLEGYRIQPDLVDLDGDGEVELVLSSFGLSTESALQGGSVVRTLLVYRRDPEGVFSRRPSYKLEERFSAKEAKALGQRMRFDADVVGEGHRQALHTDADGALIAREFDEALRLRDEPVWRFVPRRTIVGVTTLSLNADRRTDLVLRHQRSLTVLVSR